MSTMKRNMIWLDEKIDKEAIRIIRERYGCQSDSAAMRLALRVLAASPTLQIHLLPDLANAKGNAKDEKQ